ncbi:hypothetical protein [Aurantimonas sp. HBX-1]|uniref:hypothetical protein n=1 Tax=Aurantimonas sp. HBX-1 TaxID=2906072 RepID=UPI001F20AC4B|nr:hypothetical protein [Aurantimonas sp. HBX-1]UIJ72948.1 hypothetical protein LXB15_04640 [Aurantimonas sp. HBX-1]
MGEGKDNAASLMGTKRLADAVRKAKIAAAHRSDVVVDIREADRARLEILAEELQPLLDELPPGEDLFDFTISGGMHPRLWIDGTANVMMARDRRTYRLVRETRLGRVVLMEAAEPRVIADRVTDYVAERIVERDKAFAAEDGLNERMISPARPAKTPANDEPLRVPTPPSRAADVVVALTWLMIGVVIGAGILLAIASYQGVSIG